MSSAGSGVTFEELAVPLLAALYRHARWICGDASEAEDLVQETITKALRAFASFEQGTNFQAWVFRILRNTFLTSRTGIAAARTVLLEDHPEVMDAAESGLTPEEHLIRLDNQAVVHEALDKLPAPLRDVLLLCDMEGMKYREIALVLDVPMGTVMSRVSRGRQMLQQMLQSRVSGTAVMSMMDTNEMAEHVQPEMLNAFVDGELAGAAMAAVQAHVESCHVCALRALTAVQLKSATKRATERYAPSADVLARLRRGCVLLLRR